MEPLSRATREIMWNVPFEPLLYVVFAAAVVVFGFGVYKKVRSWRRGKPDDERFSNLAARLFFVLREVFFQTKVRQKRFPGLIHAFSFYSFLVLVMTTSVVALDYDFGTSLFQGYFYVLLTVAAEAAGVAILVGICAAVWRRYVTRPATLEAKAPDAWGFALLALIIFTGFLAEALRIVVAGDPWQGLSFIACAISPLFAGLDAGAGATLHAAVWWVHAVLAFVWIAAIPYTHYRHLLALPANAFFSKRKPAGELARVDIDALVESEAFDEEDFSIGVGTIRDLTWKQRLDGDACVECGRCEEACPAFLAGRPFSPKKLIVATRDLTRTIDESEGEADDSAEIVGNAFGEDFVWHCLTCMACTEACPAYIAHVDTFVDIRRNEISMKGRAPEDVSRVVRSMEVQGNPFGSQITRGDWVKSLGVRVIEDGESCDVLYWVGCLTTFDEDKRQIATDLIGVLDKCGIDFGLLGKAEVCCGEPLRVCGDENAFQANARGQVEALNRRNFSTLLVSCPHCYNVLKNEFPQFGGAFNVVHHSELLRDLLRSGKLRPEKANGGKAVFHDPCYLGRYQGIFDAPREVIGKASGSLQVEMTNCRENSFCCGGGGGHFWMETKEGDRIDTMRIREAKEVNAETLVTGCPYCLHMLGDAIKTTNLGREIRVVDLVSYVARHGGRG